MFSFCIWCISVIRQFRKKMIGIKRSKTVQCMICFAVSADSSSKDSFAPYRWDGQRKKRGLRIFFQGWGLCPTSLQKSKTWWKPRATLENSNDLCYIINNLIGLKLQISTWSWLESTGPNKFNYWNSRPQVALWWPDVITQPWYSDRTWNGHGNPATVIVWCYLVNLVT